MVYLTKKYNKERKLFNKNIFFSSLFETIVIFKMNFEMQDKFLHLKCSHVVFNIFMISEINYITQIKWGWDV